MNSCVASSCTCSPKVSYVFATSVSWPIGDVPLCSRFAFSCSARYKNPQPIRTSPPPMTRTTFGAAPSVVDRWWSSKGSPLQKSNFVLNRCSLPHETTLSNSNTSRVSACSLPLRLAAEQISSFSFRSALSGLLFRSSQSPLLSAVLYRTASATLHTAVSPHSISIGPVHQEWSHPGLGRSRWRSSSPQTVNFLGSRCSRQGCGIFQIPIDDGIGGAIGES